MTDPGFDSDTLARLRDAVEVRIETRRDGAEAHRTIIWIVVDPSGRVLIRSHRGASARWYREATSAGTAVLLADGLAIDVRVLPAADQDRIEACSRALAEKYVGDPATPSMLRDEVLDTTLELVPG